MFLTSEILGQIVRETRRYAGAKIKQAPRRRSRESNWDTLRVSDLKKVLGPDTTYWASQEKGNNKLLEY